MHRLHSLLAFCLLTMGLAIPPIAEAQTGRPLVSEYRLQPGDSVQVSVLEDMSIDRQVLVRPDGKISLPLVGTVQAAGRTPEALQAAVRQALAPQFVAPPTVTVSLVGLGEEYRELLPVVYVLGEVATPGRFTYEPEQPMNVLQALSLAGGPDVFAAKRRIQIHRMVGGQKQVMLFDYKAIEEAEGVPEILQILDGDVIVVPERGLFE